MQAGVRTAEAVILTERAAMPKEVRVGAWRGVMLEGGRGARLHLRRTSPHARVDAPALDMAHAAEGAARVAAMAANAVFLVYSWGLPPELDEVDRLGFGRVVRLYHERDVRVIAGVMASSYAAQASYSARGWAAYDAGGARIPAQIGRLYACWNDPDWQAEVQAHLLGALDAGADGVWLMHPWAGGIPLEVAGGLLGPAGCSCARCRAQYAEAAGGASIPRLLALGAQDVKDYLAWRAALTARQIGAWAAAVRAHRPDALIAAEAPPAQGTLGPVRYGHDAAALGEHLDLYLLRSPLGDPAQMSRNASALATAQARLGTRARAASVPGPDRTRPRESVSPGEFTRAIGAAAAQGGALVIDGTPFVEDRALTLLLAGPFEAARASIGAIYGWLAAQRGWLGERANSGPLAIYCPPAFTWWKNAPVEPVIQAACAAVVRLGLPLRVVGEGPWDGVQTLIVPPGQVAGLDARLAAFNAQGGRVIALQQVRSGSAGRPLWTSFEPLPRGRRHWPLVRRFSRRTARVGLRWHSGGSLRRWIARRLRLPGGSAAGGPLAILPDGLIEELAAALGDDFRPRAQAERPVLFTLWQEPEGGIQWHPVNTAAEPQRVTLSAPDFISGWAVAPGQSAPTRIFGSDVVIPLEVYKVLRLPPQQP